MRRHRQFLKSLLAFAAGFTAPVVLVLGAFVHANPQV